MDMKLEVVVVPVSDIDTAKRFYEGLGWRLDADLGAGEARDELAGHGVPVGETFHLGADRRPAPGPDPDRRSYSSYAWFSDPDGNEWALQEITERLPGRV